MHFELWIVQERNYREPNVQLSSIHCTLRDIVLLAFSLTFSNL